MANKIIFAADTAAFAAPVQKSATEVRALSAELKKVEAGAKAAFKQAELSAKAAGLSTEELKKIQQDYAREQLAIAAAKKQIDAEVIKGGREAITSAEAQVRANDRITESLKRQRAEVAKQLPLQEQSEHYSPTRVQRNGTLVRGGGMRAAELSASLIPGFDAAANVAFPVLGLGTLAMEVGEGIAKLREMRQEAIETGARLREGFEAANAPIEQSTDSLRKQNAELAIAIAKLEHKPNNGLALAAAEAALAMDGLADRANNAYAQVKKLLSENRIGFFKGAFTEQGNTSEAANLTEGGFRDIARRTSDLRRATREKGEDSPEARAAQAALDDRQQRLRSDLAAYQSKINGTITTVDSDRFSGGGVKKQRYDDVYGNQDANRQIVQGALDSLDDQAADDAERKKNGVLSQKQKQLDLQKSNASASLAAQKKAAEDQRKQWDDDLAALQASGKASADAVVHYWIDRENASKKGSENYLYADKRANEGMKQLNDERIKLFEESLKWRTMMSAGDRSAVTGGALWSTADAYAKGLAAAAKSGMDLKAQQEDAARSIAMANVQYDLQAGKITRGAAATQLATLHTMQYEASLKRLQDQKDAVQDGPNADAQRNGIQSQIVGLQTQRAMEQLQDQAAIAATTLRASLRGIGGSMVSELNGDLAQAFTNMGRRGNGREFGNAVGQTFRNVGGRLVNTGLERAESSLLGAFGLGGKPDGTQGNALWVRMVGGGTGNVFADGDLLSKLGGAVPTGSNGGFGGFLSSAVGLFGGARALGGGVEAGKLYLTGENGPELFSPSSSGYVSSAARTQSMFGGGSNPVVSVDARGSMDPAQVRAQARRGAMEGHAAAVNAQADAQREARVRRPRNS